jgi:demethylspheroidene O-methyltransferase
MEGLTGAPDAEFFYGLYDGAFKPQLVRIAVLLDVFTRLSGEPLDAAGLGAATGASTEGIERLADYLVAIGLLGKAQWGYSLTPSAGTFLVRTSKAYAGDVLLGFTDPDFSERVMGSLRSGQPTALLERFDQDAWVESYRTSRIAGSLDMWKAAGVAPTGHAELRILDLACGCGIKSLCLAQEERSVRVVCVDQPEVLAVTRDLAERMGVADRVELAPGDLLCVGLGEGIYDACLAGQITHYLTEAQTRDLFSRVNAALVTGGRFLIDVPMGGSQTDETAAFLSLVLWANSGGTAYTYEEYHDLLREGGFTRVRRAGERLIVAEGGRHAR